MEIILDRKTKHFIYFVLFAISGFSGLIYESIWTHYLKLFLGCAAYAQTLVLIIFMGCMALGSWLTGKYSIKIRNLLLVYAVAEGIIGIFALVFHSIFIHSTNFVYFSLIPHIDSVFLVRFIKWTLAALMIIPQTILLGSTFPLMSGGLIRGYTKKPGRTLAILYFTNSIGGAIGVIVSGFVLIRMAGLPGTVLFAGGINIGLAIIVWLLCHNSVFEPVKVDDNEIKLKKGKYKKTFWGLLLCACLTGTASFLYEIGWIRMLSLVLGASTHAFELMLSAFIFGIALGGLWIKGRIDSLKSPLKTLGIIQLVMGVLALLTLIIYGRTFNIMNFIINALANTIQGYGMFNILSHVISMVIMVPVTICAGMTLPLITYYLVSKGYGEGAIGKTYAANTLGGIIGVIIAIQFVMPLLGVKNVILFGGGIDIVLGLALLWYAKPGLIKKSWYGITAGMICIFVLFIWGVHLDPIKMSSGVFRYGIIPEEREILFHKDGKTSTVDLYRIGEEQLVLSTNGKPDASVGLSENISGDEVTQILIGALPMAVHRNTKNVACIGIGSGMTSHIVLTNSEIENVDVIEIEKAMVQAAKGFGSRVEKTFNDPRCHIYIGDAKTFFINHQKSYDIIISEPSNPWVSGVASLFTREFYHQVKNHLTDRGIFTQWIQLYEISTPLVASVIKALSSEFQDYILYFMDEGNILLIASQEEISYLNLNNILNIPTLKDELHRIHITSIHEIALRRLGSKNQLDPLFQSYEIAANSDYFPILDIYAVSSRYLMQSASELYNLKRLPGFNLNLLKNDHSIIQLLSVNRKSNFLLSQDTNNAILIYRYFKKLSENETIETEIMEKSVLQTIRNFRSIYYQPHVQELEKGWLPFLHEMADYTLPYLSDNEMKNILQDLHSVSIFSEFPDTVKNWIGLYESLGSQDYRSVCNFVYRMIPAKGEIKNTFSNNRILIYAMLSHNALHQYSMAMKLFERYEEQVKYPIEIRYLKEQAEQALGKNEKR